MTSIGRGRGWSKNPDPSAGLRRPGQPLLPNPSSNVDETDEWILKINELDINEHCGAKAPESPLASTLMGTPNEIELKRLGNVINKSLEDRNFAVKFIIAFKNPYNYTISLLSHLQPHFEDREKMAREDLPRLLNLVYVLSEIYHRVRYGYAGQLKALESPLITCYDMLLGLAGEEEIELASTQIALNGRMMSSTPVEGLSELIIHAREILATRNLSSRSRVLLMLIIDLYNQEFMPLSGELQKFYAEHLGQDTLLEMQSNSEHSQIWIITDNHNKRDIETEDTKNENSGCILMKVPKYLTQQAQQIIDKKTSLINESLAGNNLAKSNNSVPRAIRGSGATKNKDRADKKFNERKDKGDGQWSNWNDGNNKSWNHDDRFSKDY